MSNPWETRQPASLKTLDVGDMEEYFELAQSLTQIYPTRPQHHRIANSPLNSLRKGEFVTDQPIIQRNKELFQLVDECSDNKASIKAEKVLEKYGEFISSYEIEFKTQLLNKLSDYMNSIISNHSQILDRISEEASPHTLLVEEDKQKEFLNLLECISKEVSLSSYSELLNQVGKSYNKPISAAEQAMDDLSRAADKCRLMNDTYTALREVLLNIQQRYGM
jgi:hypothetical protein